MAKGTGEFLGVRSDWYTTLDIDREGLETVFALIRAEAARYGCGHFPSRDDLATNETLFRDVVRRYEQSKGIEIDRQWYPEFRRWILLTYKAGGTPNS